RVAVGGHGLGDLAAAVAEAAAAVVFAVGVEHFAPVAVAGHADAVALAVRGGVVANDEIDRALGGREAQVGGNAGVGVLAVDPAEAAGIEVVRAEGGFVDVEFVEVAHEQADAFVVDVLQ